MKFVSLRVSNLKSIETHLEINFYKMLEKRIKSIFNK